MEGHDVYAEKYRLCVLDVAKKYLIHLDKEELLNMKQQFEIWKKEPDKLNVNNLYTLSGWRALYTQNLFMSRISTMLLTFRQVMMQPHVVDIMRCIKRVVSIGCGPGPDIVAVLMILRNNIGVKHFIKVIGIDQFIGWRQYVLSLNKVDLNGFNNSIEFWQLRVEENSLNKVLSAEMCVMSYTDAAIHTLRFWQGLKQKFSLIVILDQKKGSLTRLLRREQFRMVEYEYKGTKRFFYWVDPRGVKESLGHVNIKGVRASDMNNKPGARDLGDSFSQVGRATEEGERGEEEGEEEEGEDEDEDDGEDDNSEQQRELAAIFDRLGNIGKMPVAQLNELNEVQKIRYELLRTADAAPGCTRLSTILEPKESYTKALEPQKNLSKERKNQLLKAKLRELGVTSDDDDDEEEEEVKEEDGEEGKEPEIESSTDKDINEYDKSDECLDSKCSVNDDSLLPFETERQPQEEELTISLPIVSGPSAIEGNAIPTLERQLPTYSPPIIVPPIGHASSESAYPSVYPPCYSSMALSSTYPPVFPLMEQHVSIDPQSLTSIIASPNASLSNLPGESFSFDGSLSKSSYQPPAPPNRSVHGMRSPSLNVLPNGFEEHCGPPFRKRNHSSGSERDSSTPRFESKRKKCSVVSVVKPGPFGDAKTKVKDLREVLNLRRKNKSDS